MSPEGIISHTNATLTLQTPGQPGVKLPRNAVWPPNLVGRTLIEVILIAGVKCHAGVSWDQVGVNLLNNALWPPNLVRRTSDQSVMHC